MPAGLDAALIPRQQKVRQAGEPLLGEILVLAVDVV